MNNLRDELKNLTANLHTWLEDSKQMQNIKSEELTKEEYINLLSKLYCFIKVLEQNIKKYTDDFKNSGLEDIEQRVLKTTWLKEDLDFYKKPLNEKEIEFKTLNNFSSIVGALYVIEGSTMGGMQISKILNRHFKENISTQYYESYKEQTMPKWLSFVSWLEKVELDNYDAILGANEVFIQLKKHFEE